MGVADGAWRASDEALLSTDDEVVVICCLEGNVRDNDLRLIRDVDQGDEETAAYHQLFRRDVGMERVPIHSQELLGLPSH